MDKEKDKGKKGDSPEDDSDEGELEKAIDDAEDKP